MSRLDWMLTALLAVLVVVVGALLIVFWLQRSDAENVVNNSAVETSSRATHTAQSAYALAEPVAGAWAPDARLVNASGTWPQNAFAPDGANWAFLFHSRDEEATALVSVEGERATLIGPTPSDRQVEPVGLERWDVDSPAVVEAALGEGGQDFIDSHEDVEMALTLETDRELIWRVIFFATGTGENLELLISPATGQVVSKR
jgi:hypothetical protein